MEQAGNQGECEAPCGGWETLAHDLRELTLGKLSFPELAQAALVCREFREAYRSGAASLGAAFIAAAKEAYGEAMFSTFVTVLRRAMLDLSPVPELDCADAESQGSFRARDNVLIVDFADPTRPTARQVHEKIASGDPCATIFVFPEEQLYGERLHACLTRSPAKSCSDDDPGCSTWKMGNNKHLGWCLTVRVHPKEAAAAMGFLMAFRLETPEGLPSSGGRPFKIRLVVWDEQNEGPAPMVSEEFLAPLRSLGVIVHRCFFRL